MRVSGWPETCSCVGAAAGEDPAVRAGARHLNRAGLAEGRRPRKELQNGGAECTPSGTNLTTARGFRRRRAKAEGPGREGDRGDPAPG